MKLRSVLILLVLIAPLVVQGQWDQIGQSIIGDQEEGYLGEEVSISDDGTTIAVGSPSYASNGLFYNGKVVVYRLVGNVWTPLGSTFFGDEGDENMGHSLSLNADGTILAIGSPYGGSSGNGEVSVYSFVDNQWSLMGSIIEGSQNNGKFGYDVSLSNDGQTLAVARFGFNGSYGSHVYEFDGSDWQNTAGGSSTDAVRSISLSADGNRLIYGGQVWLHLSDKVDGAWTLPSNISLVGDDGTNGGSSFLSMSGNGNVFAKGAELNDEGGTNAGAVIIIDRTDPDAWVFNTIIGSSFNRLGKSVSLNHDGTRLATVGGPVRIYELIEGAWTLSSTIPQGGNVNSLNAEGTIVVMGNVEYSDPEMGSYVGLSEVFGGLPNQVPALTCPADITVSAESGMCGATILLDDLFANDMEDGEILAIQTEGIPSGEVFPVGSHVVTFTATDSDGLSTSCSYTINVEDTDPPAVSCNDTTVYLNEVGLTGITAEEVGAGSFDNCGIANFVLNLEEFTCDHIGENSVELTVTDTYGNVASCSATILVVDTISPDVTCQNLTLFLDENGFASTTSSDVVLSYSDNCEIEFSDVTYDFSCDDLGVNTIVYELIDLSGNSATCITEITIADFTTPVLACQNSTVALDENGEASLNIEQVNNGSYDNCELTLSLNIQAFDCADIGLNTVVLTGADAAGNSATCIAEITVVDDMSPVITCPEDQLDVVSVNMPFEVPNYIDLNMVTAIDNCDDTDVTITQVPLPGSTLSAGEHPISFLAVDESGNEAACGFNLTIEITDNILENGLPTIEIYPNPANDQLFIKGQGNSHVNVEVYNLIGQQLISVKAVLNQPIDISELAKGEYILQITQAESIATRRLVIID